MDRYFQQLQKQTDAINKMLEPAMRVARLVEQQTRPIEQMFNQPQYLAAFKQMEAINESFNNIQQLQFQFQPINKFLENYNQVSDLINNYDNYFNLDEIEEKQPEKAEEIKQAKEAVGKMPDLENASKEFSPEQVEQLRMIMVDVIAEVVKDKETKVSFPTKLVTGLTLFNGIPEVPEAIEKYYIVAKMIIESTSGMSW